MSIASIFLRRIAAWWGHVARPVRPVRPARPVRSSANAGGRLHRASCSLTFRAARWRSPWLAWQILSWLTGTLLAPPFWVVGSLLAINPHSDQPFFWPSLMAIIAMTNAIAIVHTNQRHHRRPFAGSAQIVRHYLGIGMHVGCALFLLLAWMTGVLEAFAGPLGVTFGITGPLGPTLWTVLVTVAFGLLSFMPASVLHAWLAFDTQR